MLTATRGIRLYDQLLLIEEETPVVSMTAQQIGRSPELIAARDNFLLHRFYFKVRLQRKNRVDTIDELQKETYLSKTMIGKILQAKADNILLIKKQEPSVELLKEAWPHIIWK
jgi:hypothetical protein